MKTNVGGSLTLPANLAAHLQSDPSWKPLVCLAQPGTNVALFRTSAAEPDFLGVPKIRERADRIPWLDALHLYGAAHTLDIVKRIWRYLRVTRPDLIHIHNVKEMKHWGILARLMGIPIVFHVHTHEPKSVRPVHIRMSDHLIFVSDASKSAFERVHRIGAHSMVHNSVDLERFHPTNDPSAIRTKLGIATDRLTLGFVGNLEARKRPDWAVRTAIELLNSGRDIQLVVVGEDFSRHGEMRKRLEGLVAEAGARAHIHILGYHPDVPEIMRALDLFMMCSEKDGEAFPMVVLEAMASGAPVVSTRSAGVPEAIEHEESGLLVDPDRFDLFEKSVRAILERHDFRLRLRQRALDVARTQFSMERCASEVTDVYRSVLARKRTRA